MKYRHSSVKCGDTLKETVKIKCPFSLSLRWEWKGRYHHLDVVPFGELETVEEAQ